MACIKYLGPLFSFKYLTYTATYLLNFLQTNINEKSRFKELFLDYLPVNFRNNSQIHVTYFDKFVTPCSLIISDYRTRNLVLQNYR